MKNCWWHTAIKNKLHNNQNAVLPSITNAEAHDHKQCKEEANITINKGDTKLHGLRMHGTSQRLSLINLFSMPMNQLTNKCLFFMWILQFDLSVGLSWGQLRGTKRHAPMSKWGAIWSTSWFWHPQMHWFSLKPFGKIVWKAEAALETAEGPWKETINSTAAITTMSWESTMANESSFALCDDVYELFWLSK